MVLLYARQCKYPDLCALFLQADKVEDVRAEEAIEEPKKEVGSFKEEPKSRAVPAELLRKSDSHAQSPSKSTYA